MKVSKKICLGIIGTCLITASAALAVDQQRDRLQIHKDDPLYLQTRDRDRLKICCEEFMTPQEIEEYKRQYLALQTEQARNQFRQRHEEQMRLRADQQGTTVSATGAQKGGSQSGSGSSGGNRGGNGSQGNGGNSNGGGSSGGSGGGNGGGNNGGKGGGKGGGGKR
ncbi:hypothetical protein [Desulfopila sp. IMCC35008]|uniref:hypothetical protein n=1 Tax=Desulfopila sp. IMCC35008 TaxID=2653858 RepID=UPI0013D7C4DD|nr:hypothetical protein [Desulfopila sp. IMCC35008]